MQCKKDAVYMIDDLLLLSVNINSNANEDDQSEIKLWKSLSPS